MAGLARPYDLQPRPSHDDAARLLQLAQDPRQRLFHELRNLVLLLVLSAMVLLLAAVLATMVLLLLATGVPVLAAAATSMMLLRRDRLAALQINVYPPGVVLGGVLEAELAAQLLDLGLDLLHVARRVVALADDGVQVRLAAGLVGADALLEDALRLLDEEPVQVDLVAADLAGGVVLAEDVVGRLLVELVHLAVVHLALVGELLGGGAVARVVRLLGLLGGASASVCCVSSVLPSADTEEDEGSSWGAYPLVARVALRRLGARRIAQAVVLALDVVIVARVQGCVMIQWSATQSSAPRPRSFRATKRATNLGPPVSSWESTW